MAHCAFGWILNQKCCFSPLNSGSTHKNKIRLEKEEDKNQKCAYFCENYIPYGIQSKRILYRERKGLGQTRRKVQHFRANLRRNISAAQIESRKNIFRTLIEITGSLVILKCSSQVLFKYKIQVS